MAARRIQGRAAVFYRAQKFAHGACKAVVEPGASELRPRHSSFGIEFDRLMTEVRALAGNDAICADDRSRIARAVSGRAIEDEQGLTAVKGDKRLGQNRRTRGPSSGSRSCRTNETSAVADNAREKIEPMDAKIPEDEIVHGFERRPCDPAVVPADLNMSSGDFPDQARADRLPDIGEVRRPAAVLIDGKLEATPLRQLNKFLAVGEVLVERC